jgi:hypothetical protein
MTRPDTLDLPLEAAAAGLDRLIAGQADGAGRIAIDPDRVERDLARLVLALLEFLRQLMELQALRRVENATLTPEEEERLGTALMRAHDRLRELAAAFDLTEEDLALDLGPLGTLT